MCCDFELPGAIQRRCTCRSSFILKTNQIFLCFTSPTSCLRHPRQNKSLNQMEKKLKDSRAAYRHISQDHSTLWYFIFFVLTDIGKELKFYFYLTNLKGNSVFFFKPRPYFWHEIRLSTHREQFGESRRRQWLSSRSK